MRCVGLGAMLCCSTLGVNAHAETELAQAAPLIQCQGAAGLFHSAPHDGCLPSAASEQANPDPQRWLALRSVNGMVSYLDQTSVRRRGAEVGVILMRNAPAGGAIRTTSGEPIGSSIKRMVLNCATSMFSAVEQTLYARRFAKGEPLYTIRAPQSVLPRPATNGTLAADLMVRLCH